MLVKPFLAGIKNSGTILRHFILDATLAKICEMDNRRPGLIIKILAPHSRFRMTNLIKT
jgi:hypothetical protein